MREHEILYGFEILREKALPELGATLWEMEHQHTGAKLVWLERPEENKTFGIAFTTLPWDDTGVFHILEHSVLCGSDKYPVKEPFVELLKHSMNTFLNAMTFPDKTFYPISSRSDKDFINLMRVYLDAVFHPNIYQKPEIFLQEGWHYEFDGEGMPSYKGVVFNEMKGAFADPDELMMDAMNRALFPDTPYRWVSGGDPAKIPDLTYETFLDAHRRFYSPSNSYIFLDGGMDIGEVLSILNGEYLGGFERGDRIPAPALQSPTDGGTQEVLYELSPEENEQGRTRLAWGMALGSYADRERLIAMEILAEVLCGGNQSPLSRAILSRGLAEDVTLQVNDGVSQPWVKLEVQNLDTDDWEQTETVLFGELRRLSAVGLDREQLMAAMARLEFQLRERDFGSYPQGLIFGLQVLESWLYGGAPEANLEVGDLFDRLRAKLDTGYFENLMREVILDNPHRCKVILIPSHTIGEERRRLENDRLAAESARWDACERDRLLRVQEELLSWQHSEDTPEQLATLPQLTLADLPRTPEQLPTEMAEISGIPVLKHTVSSNGIAYLTLYFDADGYDEERLSQLSFLCGLLGELGTAVHTAEELRRQVQLHCGSLRFAINAYSGENDTRHCKVKLCAMFSTLERDVEQAVRLVTEILTGTRFDDEDAVLELLRQNKTQLSQQIVMSGSQLALNRVAAQTSAAGVADECSGGFAFYQWLKAQENDWNWPRLQERLAGLLREVVSRDSLTLSVTGQKAGMAELAAECLASVLPSSKNGAAPIELKPWGLRREGIVIPADIAFAVRGGNLTSCGGCYSGVVQLASKIITLGYLWNVIRVQGGAYGTGMAVRVSGLTCCYSYRDPNGAQSLEKYLQAGDFLRGFCGTNPNLTGFIIGAVSDDSPLLTPRTKGLLADQFYWKDISWERRCRTREEMLSATPEQLAALTEVLDAALEQGGICVVGGQNQMDACGLDEIFYL